MENNLETRYFDIEPTELRTIQEEGKVFIEGRAIPYGKNSVKLSENGKTFIETIQRSAGEELINRENSDIKLLFNHNRERILARTISKNDQSPTLKLSSDEKGLNFKAELPMDISYASDAHSLIKIGILSGVSSAFRADGGETWGKNSEGIRTRDISKFSTFREISLTPDPAYPDTNTSIASRSLEKIEEQEQKEVETPVIYSLQDSFMRKLKILKLKLAKI